MEEIAKLIDESAEKVSLFLRVDDVSKVELVNSIIDQKNVLKKVEQFCYLVIDRLKFQNNPKRDFANEIMESVTQLVPEAPTDLIKFSKWVPNFIKNNQNETELLRLKLKKCQNQINQTEKIMKKFADETNNKMERLKQRLSTYEHINNKVESENDRLKEEINYGRKEREILLTRLNSLSSELNARKQATYPPVIQKQNNSLINDINQLQVRLKNTEALQDQFLQRNHK